ncbi:pleckstrin homology domain-containing family B member 1-like [Haliotis rubra]|uniref:pleckstrin homology domain-containing family B member 1-like n=1 Tax=Haliotis rubra TaxID=36100 RepID=UPI001EE542EF|nr:pleckstrin homology domain-containing family B member 1-like [Haliotis rubra]
MSCGGTESVDVSTNSPITKTGYLRRYNKGFLSNGWKQNLFKLHADSTLAWYESQSSYEAKGGIRVKDTCQYLAVGPVCQQVPNRPDPPPGGQVSNMMAIPRKNSKQADMVWMIFSDQNELNSWMTEMVKTLPPPPQPPQGTPSAPHPGGPPPPGFNPGVTGAPPHYPPSQSSQAPPPYYQGPQQRQGNVPYPQQRGGHYPQQRGGYNGGNTTVVVQDRGRRGSGDGLATGMLMGAALGYGMSRPWGFGYGWGHGGYGGYGGWGSGGYHEGDNITVNNHYDVDNTNIENTNITENNVENNYDQGGHDQGGYDQGI